MNLLYLRLYKFFVKYLIVLVVYLVFKYRFIHSLIQAISIAPLHVRYYTARILCRSFMPKRQRQLRVKDLTKVHTWQLEGGIKIYDPPVESFDSTNVPPRLDDVNFAETLKSLIFPKLSC